MACHLRGRAAKLSSFRCHCSTALTAVCVKRSVNGLVTCSVLSLERMVEFCAKSAANCASFHRSLRHSTQSRLRASENGDDLLSCHIGSVSVVGRLMVLSLREFQPAMVTVGSSCALHSPLLRSVPIEMKALIRSLNASLSLFCLLFPPIEQCRHAGCAPIAVHCALALS